MDTQNSGRRLWVREKNFDLLFDAVSAEKGGDKGQNNECTLSLIQWRAENLPEYDIEAKYAL